MSAKRNTYDDVKRIVENEGYKLLSTSDEIVNKDGFVWTSTKIKVVCDKGHEYEVIWNSFKNLKSRCKQCHETNRKCTYEDLLEIAKDRGYRLLSNKEDIVEDDGFIKTTTYIKVKCERGHENCIILNNFKNLKHGCKMCTYENNATTYEDIKDMAENIGYELLSRKEDIINEFGYVDSYTHINVKCSKGHEYNVVLNNFKNNNTKCKKCHDEETRYTYEDLKNIVNDMGYELVSEERDIIDKDGFVPTTARISVKKECSVLFNSLINGGGYNESKGEKKIAKILDEMNIPYFKQYRFDECRYKNPLPFDFYLPQHDICIEYDGELHYESIEHFGGDNKLEETQIRDKIKTKYCKKHKIKLIRIPYWDFDRIESILEEILNKFNKKLTKNNKK